MNEIKGFDRVNIYRMCRFYEMYKDLSFVAPVAPQIQQINNEIKTIVAPVVQQLWDVPSDITDLTDIRTTLLGQMSWSHHLIIMGRCKTPE